MCCRYALPDSLVSLPPRQLRKSPAKALRAEASGDLSAPAMPGPGTCAALLTIRRRNVFEEKTASCKHAQANGLSRSMIIRKCPCVADTAPDCFARCFAAFCDENVLAPKEWLSARAAGHKADGAWAVQTSTGPMHKAAFEPRWEACKPLSDSLCKAIPECWFRSQAKAQSCRRKATANLPAKQSIIRGKTCLPDQPGRGPEQEPSVLKSLDFSNFCSRRSSLDYFLPIGFL